MLFRRFVPVMFLLVAVMPPLDARVTIGGFGAWAAFCDEPKRCFAISEPAERRDGPFLTFTVAGRDMLVQAHVGRRVRQAVLTIAGATFALEPAGDDAFAGPDPSRRIIAAIRAGEMLTVTGSTVVGRFRHHYALAGAPSAIDAAAIAARR